MRFLKGFLLSLIAVWFFACSAFGAEWYVGSTKWTAVTQWASGTAYNVGDLRRQLATPSVNNERVFRCTTAGTSGGSEPSWTLTAGGVTNDNTAVWTEVTGNSTYGWSAAHARLANAFASGWSAGGDTIYISDNHAETQASSMTLTSPGTAASPCKVFCVDDAAEPPTALATTATITTTGASSITILGSVYYKGIIFSASTGSGTASLSVLTINAAGSVIFDNCQLKILSTSTTSRIIFNASASNIRDQKVQCINTSFAFGHVSQYINPAGFLYINGGSVVGGFYPTTLFKSYSSSNGTIMISGMDLSTLGSGKALVYVPGATCDKYVFSNCLLGASVSVISGSIPGPGGPCVFLDTCDSGDPSSGPRSEAYTYQGSVIISTGVYRSGGASDGTAYSLKMATNASGVSFISPLVTRPIFKATGTTGSAMTVTAEIIQADGSTALDESECWMEVEYMGTAGSPLTSFLTDHNSTLLSASTTDQETSTATWTGLSGTPVKQKLAVQFTPAEKGYYMVRIYLARANAIVYVCPKLTVSCMPFFIVWIIQLFQKLFLKRRAI